MALATQRRAPCSRRSRRLVGDSLVEQRDHALLAPRELRLVVRLDVVALRLARLHRLVPRVRDERLLEALGGEAVVEAVGGRRRDVDDARLPLAADLRCDDRRPLEVAVTHLLRSVLHLTLVTPSEVVLNTPAVTE